MKYIKYISVSLIVLTLEIVILKILNDAYVRIKLNIVISFIIIIYYVIAFIVLNKVIVNMMMTEWFYKPKMYQDLDNKVNGKINDVNDINNWYEDDDEYDVLP